MRIIANENVSATVIRELRSRGHFCVVTDDRIRIRPLPGQGPMARG
jgi:hypothetical protein